MVRALGGAHVDEGDGVEHHAVARRQVRVALAGDVRPEVGASPDPIDVDARISEGVERARAERRELAAVAHERDRHVTAAAEHRGLARARPHGFDDLGDAADGCGDVGRGELGQERLDERDVQRPVRDGELVTRGERIERQHHDEARHPAILTGARFRRSDAA